MLPSLFLFDSPFYQSFIDLDDGNCMNVLRNLQYSLSLMLSVLLYAGCFACCCYNFLECLTRQIEQNALLGGQNSSLNPGTAASTPIMIKLQKLGFGYCCSMTTLTFPSTSGLLFGPQLVIQGLLLSLSKLHNGDYQGHPLNDQACPSTM
jgi:hypothetical protein